LRRLSLLHAGCAVRTYKSLFGELLASLRVVLLAVNNNDGTSLHCIHPVTCRQVLAASTKIFRGTSNSSFDSSARTASFLYGSPSYLDAHTVISFITGLLVGSWHEPLRRNQVLCHLRARVLISLLQNVERWTCVRWQLHNHASSTLLPSSKDRYRHLGNGADARQSSFAR
jgi:hypothetical protein